MAEAPELRAGPEKGDWRATLRPVAAGAYTLAAEGQGGGKAKKADTQFLVEIQDLETVDILADHETLKAVAQAGGGTFRTLDGLAALLAEMATDRQPVYETTVRRWPLASGGVFLAILIGLLAAEWGLRRLWGLA